MTKFLQKSFSVGGASSDVYRDNYERIFSKSRPNGQVDDPRDPSPALPDPLQRDALDLVTDSNTCPNGQKMALHDVTIRLPMADYEALREWADRIGDGGQHLDPDVAHTVLMAAADAVIDK